LIAIGGAVMVAPWIAVEVSADTGDATPAAASACGRDAGIGQKLKPFELRTPDGKTITSDSLRGRVTLVNFWGTWCEPCRSELPEFDRLLRKFAKGGAVLLAIATDEDARAVEQFVGKNGIQATVVVGGEDYAGSYEAQKFPFSFVVDRQGIIRASYDGYRPQCSAQLEKDLAAAVAK